MNEALGRHGKGFRQLLAHCGGLTAGERLVVVTDTAKADMAEGLVAEARRLGGVVELHRIPDMTCHGEEPPPEVADAMASAGLLIGLTTYSLAHSQARRRACAAGARYLSLPDYSWALLEDPSLEVDFHRRAPTVRRVADALSVGDTVRVTTALGTDITMSIAGRAGNFCPGFVKGPGELGSPPDIEANVSPLEDSAEGVVVVDGSIPCPQIGLLRQPITLRVAAGRITAFEGGDEEQRRTVEAMFQAVGSDKARVLAECGIGLNEAAELTGVMLTDEGAMGTMHFGFGSNNTVGGVNDVPFHLDFVFRSPTLVVDGQTLLKDGRLTDV